VLPDEQKVDEVSCARGAAALVRPRIGVQLLSDLPLQRHQPDLYRVESELGQESRAPCGLSIPRVRYGNADVDLQRLERPSSEGALQLVSHGQTYTRRAEFFGTDHGEGEVVANFCNGRTLEICACLLNAAAVIRVQVDRDARTLAEPGLEREPTLQSPSTRRNLHQAHHQPFEPSLTTENVCRDPETTSTLAEPGLNGGTKGGGSGVLKHVHRSPGWPVRRASVLVQSGASRPRGARSA